MEIIFADERYPLLFPVPEKFLVVGVPMIKLVIAIVFIMWLWKKFRPEYRDVVENLWEKRPTGIFSSLPFLVLCFFIYVMIVYAIVKYFAGERLFKAYLFFSFQCLSRNS